MPKIAAWYWRGTELCQVVVEVQWIWISIKNLVARFADKQQPCENWQGCVYQKRIED